MKIIKTYGRLLIEKTLDKMGYDFYVGKRPEKDIAYLDKNNWQPFKEKDDRIQLYNESMMKTDMLDSNSVIRELRFHTLQQIIQHVLDNNIHGDFAECGCWKGLSSYITCKMIKKSSNVRNRKFHIFDSFEDGLSSKVEEDRGDGTAVGEVAEQVEKVLFASTENQLNSVLQEFDFYTLRDL